MITGGDVIGIVTAPLVNGIHFCINLPSGMVRVHSPGYYGVATNIRDGRLAVGSEVNPGNSAQFSHNWPSTPVLAFRASLSAYSLTSEMTVIHECTHALLYFNGRSAQISTWDNETAAYIAEAVYLEAAVAGGRPPRTTHGQAEELSSIARQILDGAYEVRITREVDRLMQWVADNHRYHR